MTATHTPGPWSEPGTYGTTRFEIIGNSKSVAIVNRIDDARLIAAAPELLAALEAVDEFWAGGDAPPELTAQMRTAIAKARGA